MCKSQLHNPNPVLNQRPFESLVFYLTHGYLPWWENETIQSKLLPKWGEILQKSPLARQKFIELIGRNTIARNRFLSQIPEAERKSWMNYLIDEGSFFSQLIPSLPDILDQMTQDASTQREGEKLFWEILIKETFHHFSVSSGKVTHNFLHRNLLGQWIQSWVSEARILTFFNRITQFRPFFSGKLAGIPSLMKKSFQEGVLQVLAYYQKNHPKASMAFSRSDLEASFPGIEQIWEQYIPKIEDEGRESKEKLKTSPHGKNSTKREERELPVPSEDNFSSIKLN